uniref:Zinc finger DNA-directed DNA polymerase family B alpha domain-containing protein n=1 Tax=Panagrolaimus sp. JU765 TaxID=591449 RepID=A0AC34QWY0_9BILA
MNDENNDPGLEAEFNACDGFALECPDCGKVQIIRSVINEDGRLSFSECPSCKLDLTQNALGIEIQLMEALQAAFKKCRESVYKCDDDMCNYTQTFKPMMKNNFGDVCPKCEIGFLKKEESVYKCDDDMCNYTQTFKPMMKNNFGDVCPKCEIGFLKKEYTWRKLYIQQKFWLKIVNLHEFLAKEATPQQKKMIENDMKFTRLSKYHDVWTKRVKDTVSQNAYSKVDLSHIFAPMEIV